MSRDLVHREHVEYWILYSLRHLRLDWSYVFATLDPYAIPQTRTLAELIHPWLERPILDLIARFWPDDRVSGLRQIWACACANPLDVALVAQGVKASGDPTLAQETDRLVRIAMSDDSDGFLEIRSLAQAVLQADLPWQIPPDLGSVSCVKPGLRLRYRLAHYRASGAGAAELIRLAVAQSNASAHLRERELKRAMLPHSGEAPVRMDDYTFASLPRAAQDFIVERGWLWEVALEPQLARLTDRGKWARDIRKAHRQAVSITNRARRFLADKRFVELNGLLSGFDITPIAKRVVESEGPAPFRYSGQKPSATKTKSGTRIRRQWTSLSQENQDTLTRLWPKQKVPRHWGSTASEIAADIATKKLAASKLDALELHLLRNTWSIEDERKLFEAGYDELLVSEARIWKELSVATVLERVRQRGGKNASRILATCLLALPDARDWLVLMAGGDAPRLRQRASVALSSGHGKDSSPAWGRWVASTIGSPEWYAVEDVAKEGLDLWHLGIGFLRAGRIPVDPQGFRRVLGNELLRTPAKGHLKIFKRWMRWMAVDAEGALGWLSNLTPSQVVFWVTRPDLTYPALVRLEPCVPPDLRQQWRDASILKTESMVEARDLLVEGASAKEPVPWRDEWLTGGELTGARLEAVVIAARRNSSRLQKAAEKAGPKRFQDAVRAVIRRLPKELHRDRGLLELMTVVDSGDIALVGRALRMTDPRQPSGHKLDFAYKCYDLPKKSGGTRTISVPHPVIKRVQRIILERLLRPLGQHESACGFVVGKSIIDNAEPHVGQQLVVNADVRNCFPSVRWPLVLGALRRELQAQVSPAAISLLVDLCTAQGALPIGAPTSPALLNLVLRRTDAVLEAEANRRDCRYTRYADDLTFSGDRRAVEMLGVAKRTLQQIGLELDPRKTNIFRRGRRQVATGLVVNERVSIPRRIRRRLRAAVHRVEQGQTSHWHGKEQSHQALYGRISFLQMVHPKTGKALHARLPARSAGGLSATIDDAAVGRHEQAIDPQPGAPSSEE